ncbi:MAG TPA: ClbS/DfsB family four-helix bundle protein [Aggregatilineales bacterium]|nr:ClbS/DfsB family four-helix bundle protein [Anaerolineales bacterium]HRE47787.1 ClbS/DfsB family four-helix bundle protein [Aggregatilineales bacterium]
MQKKDLLNELRAARTAFLIGLEGLSDDALLRPGACGLWSVKDVLTHLTSWESELVTALAKLDPKNAPNIVRIEDIDEWNQDQYAANAAIPLALAREDFEGVHKHLIKMIEGLDEVTLTDPRRFRWMEGEPLTYLILDTAVWHEKEHLDDIRAWREEAGL